MIISGRGRKMFRNRTKKVYSIGIVILFILSSLSTYLDLDMAVTAEGGEILDPVVTITDPIENDKFGWNVSWIGDVNGDGYDDVIVGAPYTDVYPGINSWWNNSWIYRRQLTFNNSGQSDDLTNFPVLVNLSALNFNYSKAKFDGTDLRFIDENCVTELNYHIENWDPLGYSNVWVNVTYIEGGSSLDYMWMYYGNPTASNAQNIEGTYDGNFSGVWHLNETSGNHYDATKNDNDGSPQNGLTQNSQGRIDGADNFDGIDDYVNCKTSDSLNITQAITIEAWIKPVNIDNIGDDQNIVNKFETGAASYLLSMDDDPGDADDWDFKLSTSGVSPEGEVHASNQVDRNQWQYIIGTWNGTTMILYKNAMVLGTNTTFSGPIYQSATEVWIGNGNYYDAFEGIIDEVRISNIARSADWISAQFLSMNNSFITYGSEEKNDWWDNNWSCRKKLTFDNSGQSEDLEYFPVLVKLNFAKFDYIKAKADGTDLRFVDFDGITPLNYHIEEWNPLGDSYVWVNVTQIDGGSSTDYIWMYYTNLGASDVQDIPGTYDVNFSAVYHLNETSGTHYDATSNDNDGSIEGDTNQDVPGIIGGADSFDGSGDSVNCGTSDSLNITTEITLEAWVKTNGEDGPTTNPSIIGKYSDPDLRAYVLKYDDGTGNDDDWEFYLSSSGTTGEGEARADLSVINDVWQYMVGTWNGTTMVLYRNASSIDTGSFSGPIYHSSTDLLIGNSGYFASYNGTIDEVRISNKARSADWISAQYLSMNDDFITYSNEETVSSGAELINDAGAAYIFFGYPGISPSQLDVLDADVTIYGSNSEDLLGWSVSDAGDINKDGYDDVIIGAPGWGVDRGRAYIFHGRATLAWESVYYADSDADVILTGENAGDKFGFSVSGAGDVNSMGSDNFYEGWKYRKKITINASQVVEDFINFPVLINVTDSDLQSKARSDGYDIFFTELDGLTRLNHETESYDGSLGELVAWIKIPSLSSSSDTIFYMYYGNFLQTTPMENPEYVWDTNYSAVWHLNDNFLDSTSKNHDGINSGSEDNGSIIAHGQDFENDHSSDLIDVGDWNVQGQGLTLQAWVKFESFASDARIISKSSSPSNSSHTWMLSERNDKLRLRVRTNDTTTLEAPIGVMTTETWYFAVGTYDGMNMRLRLDKMEVGITAKSGNIQQDARKIAIGNQPEGDFYPFDGIIDEVRVSSIRRSDAWLDTEYNNIKNKSYFYTVGSEEMNTFGWMYRKPIVINAPKVLADLVDFPVLIDIIYPELKDTARPDGYDIFFTDSDGNTKLDHEIELYNSTTGKLIAWVKVPSLSSSTDTNIYLYYGNSNQSSPTENSQGVWDDNFLMVQHLQETSGTHFDSTHYGFDGTEYIDSPGTQDASGKIDGADEFDGSNDYVKINNIGTLLSNERNITFSFWFNTATDVSNWRNPFSFGSGRFRFETGAQATDLHVFNSGIDNDEIVEALGYVTPDAWNFLTFASNDTSWTLYVDSDVRDTGTTDGGLNAGSDLYLGIRFEISDQWKGLIDEVRISKMTRSNEWINTEFNNQNDTSSFYSVGFEEINPSCWLYRKPISINSSQVSGELIEFPLLINITDSDLRDKARLDGYDIVFTESDGVTRLDHEIESYDGLNGELTAWVRIPYLSSSSDTRIYMYYGKSDQIYSLENPQGVWDDNYMMIQHLSEGSGTHFDSTRYGNDGTEYIDLPGTQDATGKIDGADEFDGNDDYIDCGNNTSMNMGVENVTLNAWIYPKELDNSKFWDYVLFSKLQDINNRYYFRLRDEDSMQFYSVIGGSIYTASGTLDNVYDFTKDSWYMISCVIDRTEGENGTLKVYHNGDLAGNFSFNVSIFGVDFSNNGNGWIGAHSDFGTPQWLFNGTIDEVRISNIARSDDWIMTQYNNQNDTTTFYKLGAEEPINNYDDIIIGAYGHDNQRGRAYIFFAGADLIGEVSAENADVIINGISQDDRLGWDVSGAGDVNNDGANDVIIGAPGKGGNTGEVYIIYGGDFLPNPIDASNADVVLLGENPGDEFGYSVSEAEDLNEDGYDDVIVGAPDYADLNGTYSFEWGSSDTLVQQTNSTGWHYPEVAVDPSGNVVFVWHGSTGGASDIYAMKLDPNGNPLWGSSDIMVNQYSTGTQEYPAVAIDSEGYIFVVWQDNRNTNHDIFAQRLSPDGTVLWPSDVMVHQSFPNQEQYDPDVAVDSNKNAIIVWRDYRSSDSEIYAQKLDPNGNALWDSSDIQVNQETSDYQTFPKVVVDSNDNAIIVWEDDRTDTDIYAQKLNYSGDYQWGPSDKLVNQNTTGLQTEPDLAVDADGNAIVVWEDSRNVNGDIYTQKLDPDGNPQWGSEDKKVNQNLDSNGQASPDVTVNLAGDAIVVWFDSRDNPTLDYEIYSQKFDPSGSAQWGSSDKKINQNSDSAEQNRPAVAVDHLGNIYTTWYDNRSGPWMVYAQKLSPPCPGRAYIYHGGTSLDSTVDLILEGESTYDKFGFSVNSAGDLNGDGVADVIVGAPFYDNGAFSDAGAIYVFKGGASMDNLTDWKYYGEQPSDHFGWSVSSAGDLNGDGQEDIIVGAPDNDDGGPNAGKAYILTIVSIELTVSDIMATPSTQFIDGFVNITCNVAGGNGVSGVWLNITNPIGGYTNVSMTRGIDHQWYNNANYSIPGLYQYVIWANDTLGDWINSNTLQFEIINRLPILTSPSVNPGNGPTSASFNFTVIYTDLDNHAPKTITVNISGAGVYDLMELDPLDLDYTDGKEYYYNNSGFSVGPYSFHFAANDTIGDWGESGTLQFDVLGFAPLLSSGKVDPILGNIESWFNFTVVYTHGDNLAPDTICLNITGRGIYALIEFDQSDLVYSDGKDYYLNFTGFDVGRYDFHFAANDTNGNWNESSISSFDVLNRVPTLTQGQVSPVTGYTDTAFNFTVTYTDPDNHAPGRIALNISGYGVIDLLEVDQPDSNYSDGKEYYHNASGFSIGSYTLHFAANDTIGDWVESITFQFNVINRNPILSNMDVSPNSGFMSTLFNFTVMYTDLDNHAPITIVLNISGMGSYALFEVNPYDIDYTDGKEYYYILSGFAIGTYNFNFAASDIMGNWAESGAMKFDVVNMVPVLTSGQVDPNPGYEDTLFNFTVTYTDLDDHPPDIITVNITGIGIYNLFEADYLDTDYSDGKEYYCTVSGFSVGSYTYHFAANDTQGNWFVSIIFGFDVLNRNPFLSNENVDPQMGYIDTWFNFTVTYIDLDNHAPNYIFVNITDLGSYDLQEIDSQDVDFSDGKDYYYNLSGFTLGSYDFHFAANDTIGTWTETNAQQLDVVNRAPIISSAQVSPNTGYVDSCFNFTVTYTDLDNHKPDYMTVNITGLGVYDLIEFDSSDLFYFDGKEYYLNLSGFGIGQFPFHFAACDVFGQWTESVAFQLDVVNRPPILSLEQVDPISGSIDTLFNFSVSYTDLENHAPGIITLNITGLGVFVMMEVDAQDANYMDSKGYYYTITLSAGMYIFHFSAYDSLGLWAIETTPINAPNVSPKSATLFPIDSVSEFSDPIQLNARLLDDGYNSIQNQNVAFYLDLNNNGIYEIGEFVKEGATISDGSISVTYSSYIAVGTYNFTVKYNGSGDYEVEDAEAQLTVNPKAATLAAIIDVVEVGETATLTAILIDSDDNLIENEEIEFYLDKNRDGIYPRSEMIVLTTTSASGVASINYYVNLTPENYGIWAKYVGSANYVVNELQGLITVQDTSNTPPMILWTVPNQIKPEDNPPWTLDLTSYEADVEDSGPDLRWYLTGVDSSMYSVTGMNSSSDVLTFIPVPNAFGSDEVILWLSDSSGDTDSQVLWINITSVNDLPYFDPLPPSLYVHYDDPNSNNDDPMPWDYTFYVHDIETPIENLILTTSEPTVDTGSGCAKVNGLKVTYHYPQGRVGESIYVTLKLSDGTDSTKTLIKVTVTSNWVPELVAELPDIILQENTTLYNIFDLDDYFSDRDNDSLFFSSGYFHIEVIINANNTVDVYALEHWTGTEYVTFRARDPSGAISEDTVMVTVIPVNDGPSISNVPDLVVHFDDAYSFDLSPYIYDPDNLPSELTVWTSESTDYIVVQQYNNLAIVVTYPEELNGSTIPVIIYVSDGLKTASQGINITVTNNFPPELAYNLPDIFFDEDTSLIGAFTLSDYFFDVDSNVLFYTNGSKFVNVTINEDLTVDFTAPANWYGSEIITFRATDPFGALAEDKILVVVVPVNDAPTINYIPRQEKREGDEWILDLSLFIGDIDNDISELVISLESEVGGGYVTLVGNILIFNYPKDIHSDTITITVSDGELETSRSFIVVLEKIESPPPTFWDIIPWPWLISILILEIGIGIVIYKKKSAYQVYEAFLIHEKGLPMAHVSKKESTDLEDVVVSGMFTAVQDFINDAFTRENSDEEWELDEMKFGDHKILIERSQELYLAVIFEGNGNKLRLRVKKLLAEINSEFGEELEDWDGNMKILKGLRTLTYTLIDTKRAKPLGRKQGYLDDEGESGLVPRGENDSLGTGIEELDEFIKGVEGIMSVDLGSEELGAFECPVCGKEITTKDSKCIRCGADHEKLRKQKEGTKVQMIECPACGMGVREDATHCPNCKVEFMDDEELEVLECPMCGVAIDPSATSCYNCGVKFLIERKIDGRFDL